MSTSKTESQSAVTKLSISKLKFVIVFSVLLAFVFFYSRFLVQTLGPENPWTSYLYMYGFGGLTFLIGMWVITSSGALIQGRGRDSHWFKVLVGGMIGFAAMHALWIYLAISIPVKTAIN